MALTFGQILYGNNTDRYWQWMEENKNWNINAAVDAITPYKESTKFVKGDPNYDRGPRSKDRWVTTTNRGQREHATELLNERYKSAKDKDRMISTPILQMGSADASAQNLKPKSEADVVAPEGDGGGARPDFGGAADSGRNPAATAGQRDAGTAGLKVDDKLQGRRRNAGGIRI